jgi:hypothetical protein
MDLVNILKHETASIDGAILYLKNLEHKVDALKEEEKKKATERKDIEAAIESAKVLVKQYMIEEGLVEVEGVNFKMILSKTNPKLIIEDEALIPKDYKQETIVTTVRKDALKDDLKVGAEIPGAKLEQSYALKIGMK